MNSDQQTPGEECDFPLSSYKIVQAHEKHRETRKKKAIIAVACDLAIALRDSTEFPLIVDIPNELHRPDERMEIYLAAIRMVVSDPEAFCLATDNNYPTLLCINLMKDCSCTLEKNKMKKNDVHEDDEEQSYSCLDSFWCWVRYWKK
jgi:hypothetical protein